MKKKKKKKNHQHTFASSEMQLKKGEPVAFGDNDYFKVKVKDSDEVFYCIEGDELSNKLSKSFKALKVHAFEHFVNKGRRIKRIKRLLLKTKDKTCFPLEAAWRGLEGCSPKLAQGSINGEFFLTTFKFNDTKFMVQPMNLHAKDNEGNITCDIVDTYYRISKNEEKAIIKIAEDFSVESGFDNKPYIITIENKKAIVLTDLTIYKEDSIVYHKYASFPKC